MSRQISISIRNWDKYNPRRDLKSMPWIRLQGDIAFSEALFGLNAEAKWLWIFILSYSSKKMKGDFLVDESYLSHHSGVPASKMENYLSIFLKRGLLSLNTATSRITNESDRITNESVSNERTNERTNVLVNADVDYTHPLEIDAESINSIPKEPSHEIKCNTVANIWNEYAPGLGLSKVKVPLSQDRMRLLKAPLAEITSATDWESLIYQIQYDPFLLGDNDRKWKANFDWLIHKTKYNYRKLLEKYESNQDRDNDTGGCISNPDGQG